ncbi:MAG: acyltransferase family protein [Planctomycetota bacterium JB042]
MKLPVVNGLRGVAIVGVVLYHLLSQFTEPGTSVLDTLVENGWMGVNLFFVLSGFVLALPYFEGRRAMDGEADAVRFLRRRARRLFPLLWVNFAVALGLVAAGIAPLPVDFASDRFLFDLFFYATATFVFVPDLYYPPPNWVLWSLGLEVWFSAVFPLLLVLVRRVGIGAVVGGAFGVAFLVRVLGEQHYGGVFNGVEGAQLDAIKDSFVGRIDEFVAGIGVAWFHGRGRRAGRAAIPLLVAGAALVGFAMDRWDAVHLGQLDRDLVPALYDLTTVGFALVLLGALGLPEASRRVLANPPLQLLGMMCYSLYVWHGVLIFVVFADRPFSAGAAAAYGAALLAVSAVTYRWIEFGHVKETRTLFVPPAAGS